MLSISLGGLLHHADGHAMGIAHKADGRITVRSRFGMATSTSREVRAHLFRLAEDPNWPPGPLNLADLSTMGEVAIPDPELVALLHEGTVLETGLKTALVVRPELLAMNARQYDGAARATGVTAFRTRPRRPSTSEYPPRSPCGASTSSDNRSETLGADDRDRTGDLNLGSRCTGSTWRDAR